MKINLLEKELENWDATFFVKTWWIGIIGNLGI